MIVGNYKGIVWTSTGFNNYDGYYKNKLVFKIESKRQIGGKVSEVPILYKIENNKEIEIWYINNSDPLIDRIRKLQEMSYKNLRGLIVNDLIGEL